MKTIEESKAVIERCNRSQEFKDLIESIESPSEFEVQPESHFLHRYEWEGMITIRFESLAFNRDNESSAFRRRHLIRALMCNLRNKLGLSRKDYYWVASTEFGKSGAAHCHLIFTFFPLIRKGKPAPDLSDFSDVVEESLNYLSKDHGISKRSLDFKWCPKFDDFGLVNYVCKKEPGREFKHFEWSTEGKKWKQHALEYCFKAALSECQKEGLL